MKSTKDALVLSVLVLRCWSRLLVYFLTQSKLWLVFFLPHRYWFYLFCPRTVSLWLVSFSTLNELWLVLVLLNCCASTPGIMYWNAYYLQYYCRVMLFTRCCASWYDGMSLSKTSGQYDLNIEYVGLVMKWWVNDECLICHDDVCEY